jgi:hypothetical protein
MRILSSLDVPDDKKLNDLFWLSPVLAKWERVNPDLAPKNVYDADYILYGDYDIKQKNPETIVLRIGVWSKEKNANIFTKSYDTTTDMEIFDTIDMILKNVIEGVLKIDFSLARIDFDVKTGIEKYDIYINNKLIEAITNSSYKKSLRVLGNQNYTISLVRERDNRQVYTSTQTLGVNQNISVKYFATGSVVVDPLKYKERGKSYVLYVDDELSSEGRLFEDMNALKEHNIKVVDQDKNTVYQQTFNVSDGATIHVTPEEKWAGPFHIKTYILGNSLFGLAGLYFPERYIWVELGCGMSFISSPAFKETIYNVSPYLDAGYYFYGDMKTDIRVGAGVSLLYFQYLPSDIFDRINPDYVKRTTVTPYSCAAGVFGSIEWKWLMFKLGVNYDIMAGSIFISPSLGVKF